MVKYVEKAFTNGQMEIPTTENGLMAKSMAMEAGKILQMITILVSGIKTWHTGMEYIPGKMETATKVNGNIP